MEKKGYIVADMKPSHVIIDDAQIDEMRQIGHNASPEKQIKVKSDYINYLVKSDDYSIVDYELLLRTSNHEKEVKDARRHLYLDDQRDRFTSSPMPPFLTQCEVFDVPYVHGHAESTGGLLWVVGRNPRLFDYFLPERWRRTPYRMLSNNQEVHYTVTKDNIHIVWKTSRVGESVQNDDNEDRAEHIREIGFNSPFEEFAIAHYLTNNGIPTVYIRAIYMTGNTKIEKSTDHRHYDIHRAHTGHDDLPILREDRNYISIRGYYNGPDQWIASHDLEFYTPYSLETAYAEGILELDICRDIYDVTLSRLKNVGYDGSLLELNDMIITIDPNGDLVLDEDHRAEARICNFELLRKI